MGQNAIRFSVTFYLRVCRGFDAIASRKATPSGSLSLLRAVKLVRFLGSDRCIMVNVSIHIQFLEIK